jgi:hypothetical protein
MAEQATSPRSDPAASGTPEPAELREQLAVSHEEILRLRDLLIGRDAELGLLKGRVAELEAGVARLLGLTSRLRTLMPGPARAAVAALRSRRGARD